MKIFVEQKQGWFLVQNLLKISRPNIMVSDENNLVTSLFDWFYIQDVPPQNS